MKNEQNRKIIIQGKPIPAEDVVKYMTSLAVINNYMRHAMTAGENREGVRGDGSKFRTRS